MRRGALIAAAAAVLVLPGCGSFGDGNGAAVEESVASSMRAVLDRDAPLVEIRSVSCDGARPAATCRVDLGVGNEVVQGEYRVAVRADGCWTADAVRLVVLGAGSQTNPLADVPAASDLTGCVR